MKKYLLMMAFCLSLLLTACQGKEAVKEDKKPETKTEEKTEAKSENKEDKKTEEKTSGDKIGVKLGAMRGPTGIAVLNLVENKDSKYKVNLSISASPEEIVAGMVKGELDAAIVPANLAANLYQKTKGKVQILATNNMGVVYLLEKGDKIKSFEDLKGMEIIAAGKGTSPELMFKNIAKHKGISFENDLKVEFAQDATEVSQKLISGKNSVGIVPEPMVTSVLMKNPEFRIALDLNKEWLDLNKSNMITAVLVANKDLKDKIGFDDFIKEYKESIEMAKKDPATTGEFSEKYDLFPKAIAEKAIPNLNLEALVGEKLKDEMTKYYTIIAESNPDAIGGKLPEDDLYYGK